MKKQLRNPSGLFGRLFSSNARSQKRRRRTFVGALEELEDRRLLAGDCDCYANLFAGPRLADLDSDDSELLEGVFNALLPGSHIDLTVADWNAVADNSINVNSFLTELQEELVVSSPQQALEADVTLGQIFSAAADAVPADGPTADLHAALLDLSTGVDVSELDGYINLGDILEVTFPDGTFANVDLNALNVATAAIELYNYENVATTADPVTVSGSVFGNDIVDVELWAQVIEPPIIDPLIHEGEQFYSAAVRVKLDVDLVDVSAPLDTNLTLTDIDLYLDVARAQGEVDLIDQITRAVDIKASHGVANVYMGEISDSLFFNRSHVIDPMTDVDFGTIGSLASGGQILDVQAKAWAEGTAPHDTLLEFTGPYPESQTTGTSASFVANAAHDLLTSMEVQVTLLGTPVPDPTGDIRSLVDDTIHQPLIDIMTNVGDPVLDYLGTGIGEMDVTINAVNCPPKALDDSTTTPEDTPVQIDILANDADTDASGIDPMSVMVVSGPSNGSVSIDPVTGEATYSPDADFNGLDSFTYTVRDTEGAISNVATVDITIESMPDPPVAVDDAYSTQEDTTLTISNPGILGNDSDPDGDAISSILVSGPSNGTLSVNPDGSFQYTPDPDFNGIDTFTYNANDGGLDSNIATVTITVEGTPDPPLAVNDAYETTEDTPIDIAAPGVMVNDSDPDGDPLTSSLVGDPSHGSVTLNSDGSFTYTPDADYNGPDSFTYQVNDGTFNSNIATVDLTIVGVNDPPVAVDDAYETAEDTPLVIASPGILVNDSDIEGDPLSGILVSEPSHGTLSLNADGSFTYTPDADYNGPDSYTYKVNDGTDDSNVATVNINVTPVSDPPEAVDDAYSTSEDTPLVIALPGVMVNDSDPDGDPIEASLVGGGPSHGTVSLNADGSFTYTPDPDFNGLDTFMYQVNDGEFDSNVATVAITVEGVNDPPVATDDSYSTQEDTPLTIADPGVLVNDSDVDGDPLSSILVSGPSHGTVTLDADGAFTYTPEADYNGPDSFTYVANDGSADSNVATANILVGPANDPPVAANDTYSTDEDTTLIVSEPGILLNDSDPDGDDLSVVLVSGPSHGSVTLNDDGSFSYTPDADYSGPDSFTYQANDGIAGSNVAVVSLTVNGINDDPDAVDDAYVTNEDTPLVVAAPGVMVNDDDVDGDPLSSILVSGPSDGTLSLNSDGSFTYTPDPDFNGSDSFVYQVDDGNGGTDTATATITVKPVNDAPVAANDSYNTPEDTPLLISSPGILGNDSDPEGDLLSSSLVSGPLHGTLTLNDDGSFTYTPDADYNGPDQFTYQASDGSADSNVATVNLTVDPLNDAPVATNDGYSTNEDVPLQIAAPGVLVNDSDVDGDPLSSILVDGPSHGTLTLNDDASFTYTPDADYNGPDSFDYKANDGSADSNVATANITVVPVNDAPEAVDDGYSMLQNATLTVTAPGTQVNDSDIDSASVDSLLVSGTSNGTLSLNSDGSFTYTPDHNFVGDDSFTYRNNDGSADSNIATVTITVDPLIADLSLDMTVDDTTPYVGGEVTYTITVDNAGPTGATGVAVTDVLPAGTTYLSSSASQGSYDSSTGTWTIGWMDIGDSVTLQVTAQVDTGGAVTNTAQVSASDAQDPDSTPANGVPGEDDQDSETVTPIMGAAQITHTGTTIRDFLNGDGDDLTEVMYGVKKGKVNNVAPGVFFYWVSVEAPASSFTIDIDQAINHPSFTTSFGIHHDEIRLYDSSAERIFIGSASHQNGDVTVDVSGADAGGVYTVRVKYDPSPVVDQSTPNPTTAGYNFATAVDGSFVSQDDIDLVKKGSLLIAGDPSPMADHDEAAELHVNEQLLARGQFTVAVDVPDAAQREQVRQAVTALNETLAPFGTALMLIDSQEADIRLTTAATTEKGGVGRGVLGYASGRGEITLVEGWDWYVGADPQAIAPNQYDFQTVVTHELAHTLGLDHDGDSDSILRRQFAPGAVRRLPVGAQPIDAATGVSETLVYAASADGTAADGGSDRTPTVSGEVGRSDDWSRPSQWVATNQVAVSQSAQARLPGIASRSDASYGISSRDDGMPGLTPFVEQSVGERSSHRVLGLMHRDVDAIDFSTVTDSAEIGEMEFALELLACGTSSVPLQGDDNLRPEAENEVADPKTAADSNSEFAPPNWLESERYWALLGAAAFGTAAVVRSRKRRHGNGEPLDDQELTEAANSVFSDDEFLDEVEQSH